ncbi:MAG: AbrB/MazE/SpoVT family DNA-binding domain-containing protein [Caldilineaceae bacterium]|nr:AbrB/MazE/SpoVT family DNA-binding domain-containing protein [Caldilineaceae bacterium]
MDKQHMEMVTLSQEYQVMIPVDVRESLELRSGQRLQIIAYRNRIELVPLKPISALRGFLSGIDTTVTREADCL